MNELELKTMVLKSVLKGRPVYFSTLEGQEGVAFYDDSGDNPTLTATSLMRAELSELQSLVERGREQYLRHKAVTEASEDLLDSVNVPVDFGGKVGPSNLTTGVNFGKTSGVLIPTTRPITIALAVDGKDYVFRGIEITRVDDKNYLMFSKNKQELTDLNAVMTPSKGKAFKVKRISVYEACKN